MNRLDGARLSGFVEARLPTSQSSFGLEWHVEEGARVETGQVLAWLAVPDHCALVALTSPVSGRLSSRWSSLLTSGAAGAVVAEIDGDGATCRAHERDALARAIDTARARLASLPPASSLAALIAGERAALERWLADADDRLRALSAA